MTVVVGPNGSGKSNVVDAVAWVLGAQGPRTVRSTKMEDVIFAGSADRPALGRAEVSLTIDNRTGRLPGGLAEITITRTLFRSGESEYAINGQPCRLLDIQELLVGLGSGPSAARDREPGPAGRHPRLPTRGPPRRHRGSRRGPEAPAPPRARRAPAGRHRGEPRPARRPAAGGASPDPSPRATGGVGTQPRIARRRAAGPAPAPRRPGARHARRARARRPPASAGVWRRASRPSSPRSRSSTRRPRPPRPSSPPSARKTSSWRSRACRDSPSAAGACWVWWRSGAAPSRAPSRRRPTPTWCPRSRPTRRAWPAELEATTHEDDALAPHAEEVRSAEHALASDVAAHEASFTDLAGQRAAEEAYAMARGRIEPLRQRARTRAGCTGPRRATAPGHRPTAPGVAVGVGRPRPAAPGGARPITGHWHGVARSCVDAADECRAQPAPGRGGAAGRRAPTAPARGARRGAGPPGGRRERRSRRGRCWPRWRACSGS